MLPAAMQVVAAGVLSLALADAGPPAARVEQADAAERLDAALPRMLRAGRPEEALNRVREEAALGEAAAEQALGQLARAWLGRALTDPPLVVPAAIGLAAAGDSSVAGILEAALRRGDRAETVAPVLALIGRPICPLVRDFLDGGIAWRAEAALAALAATGEAEAEVDVDVGCTRMLLGLASTPERPEGQRAQAVRALAASADPEVRRAIAALSADGSALVRVAALTARGRAGDRRGALAGLVPLLRDPARGVRGSAAAGLVEALGEEALAALRPLLAERLRPDIEVPVAVAVRRGRLSGPESAALLARLLGRGDPAVRMAAALALAGRSDPPALGALRSLAAERDARLRFCAVATLPPEQRPAVVAAVGSEGREVYRALLGGPGRAAAGQWLLGQLDRLAAPAQVELLGAWLAESGAARVAASATRH